MYILFPPAVPVFVQDAEALYTIHFHIEFLFQKISFVQLLVLECVGMTCIVPVGIRDDMDQLLVVSMLFEVNWCLLLWCLIER